jgi:hypothetical protein
VTLAVHQEQLGVGLGIFNMVRFVSASLGATVFGIVLGSTTGGSGLLAYRLDFSILSGTALAAVALAVSLPAVRTRAPHLTGNP